MTTATAQRCLTLIFILRSGTRFGSQYGDEAPRFRRLLRPDVAFVSHAVPRRCPPRVLQDTRGGQPHGGAPHRVRCRERLSRDDAAGAHVAQHGSGPRAAQRPTETSVSMAPAVECGLCLQLSSLEQHTAISTACLPLRKHNFRVRSLLCSCITSTSATCHVT
jgi:hypothetical protein